MALTPGTRVGPYEILAPIGAGGMGEVYRARDTKLGREVAIKGLPDEFSRDKERLVRFEREAKLLASLSHPHVATLYGLEEHNGQPVLVMELVEGETLEARIARGPIPIDEAIPLFVQIAEGLEAAHDKGIIHRDLKPANIKVTPEGKPKILDFGLAKTYEEKSPANLSESPTATQGTELGVILGTASYMSPEQARGKTLDRRSDVWSYGCILYESLTGRKAFDGEDVTEVLAAILKTEPDWGALPPDVPAHVRKLLRRCLSKEREKRLRDIGDALLDLRDPPAPESHPRSALRPWGSSGPWIFFAGIVLGGVAVYWATRHEGAPPSKLTTRLSITVPTDTRIQGQSFDISPDGRNVAYVGTDSSGSDVIYLRAFDSTDVRAVAGTRGTGGRPFFSPDGRWLAFFDENGLNRVPVEGGTPQRITPGAPHYVGVHWGVDGFVYSPSTYLSPIQRVRADGGVPESVTELAEGDLGHWWPYLLPEKEALLYTVYTKGSLDDWEIRLHDLRSQNSTLLIRGGYNARYAASGHILYGRSGGLMAVAFDLESLEIRGRPFTVHANVATQQINAGMSVALSNDGTLIYVEGSRDDQLVWVGRNGTERPAVAEQGVFEFPRISPEGTQVAIVVQDGVNRSLRLIDLARGAVTRLTYGDADTFPAWSPDGASVYFSSAPNGPLGCFACRATEAESPSSFWVDPSTSTSPPYLPMGVGSPLQRTSRPINLANST
jgi:serine/threonine-protein kinase